MQLQPRRRQELSSATLTQTLGLMVAFSGVLVVASNATQPAWWSSRGAMRPVQVTTNGGVVVTNYIPNDYMVVTQGQLKQFTARAVEEMNANLSGGAGTNLNSLVSNWAADYASNGYSATNLKPSDYTAMTAGQLKYIGHLVWTRLVAAGVTNAGPSWLATNALDYQIANLGQLKSVFNFEMAASGLPQAVTNLTATAGTDEVDLTWTNPGGDSATGIVIEVSADGGATWSTVTTLDPNADTYAASADPSQSRNYRVTRENSSGSSSSASTTPVTPNSGPPVPRYAVIDLGTNVFPVGINASGTVAANYVVGAYGDNMPMEWDQGQSYPLALPASVTLLDGIAWGLVATATGISDAGVIVGDPVIGGFPGSGDACDPVDWPNRDAWPVDLATGAPFAPYVDVHSGAHQIANYDEADGDGTVDACAIASDGTVVGTSGDNCGELVRFLPTFAVLDGNYGGPDVFAASGHWAVDCFGSEDADWCVNIDGVLHPGFWAYGLNDSGLAAGDDNSFPDEAFLIGPANVDLGPGWAVALNNATVMSGTNTVAQPQVVGDNFDYGGNNYHGVLWDHLNLDGTPAAKYVAKKLDDLLPASSGWSQTYPAAINLGGAICGTANYSGTNSAIPAGVHGVILAPAEIDVDYNRDGKIVMANDPGNPANVDADGNPLPMDTTSSAKPFRFWLNNDQDTPGTGSAPETISVTTPDWQSDSIVSARDLEDWTRLWIYTKGLNTAIKAGTIKVGLKWKNVTGTPGIKIADAKDSDGGLEYLTNTTRATAQVITLEANITPSGGAADFIFQASAWNNLSDTAPITHFLFEGTGKGKGQLVVVFLKSDNTELGEGPGVWLDLHDIKEMYEREIASPQPVIPVGAATPAAPNITAAPDTTGGTFVPDPDESSTHTYVVFVHGFNQTYAGSTTFAETMFKRLWWRGYKGRFAAFRWPTYGDGSNLGAVGTYNDSEYVAWHSGTALKTFVAGLPSGYTVDIAAHSMGNLVVGEALREGMTVNHYAMLHAATSACCYSNGSYAFPTTDTTGILAPDNDTDPATSGLAYTRWLGSIGGNPKNFYDNQDTVVGWKWGSNNDLFKPQAVLTGTYGYAGWQPIGQRLFYESYIATRYLTDQGEVKAYDDHSLTGAIGFISTTSNGSILSSNNDTSFGDEHSSEWVRNIQDPTLRTFYQTLTGAACFNLQVNP